MGVVKYDVVRMHDQAFMALYQQKMLAFILCDFGIFGASSRSFPTLSYTRCQKNIFLNLCFDVPPPFVIEMKTNKGVLLHLCNYFNYSINLIYKLVYPTLLIQYFFIEHISDVQPKL